MEGITMPLRKFKQDGEVLVEIPEPFFKCPRCGAGYEYKSKDQNHGLYSDDDRESLDGDLFFADELIRCTGEYETEDECGACGWEGGALLIYQAAVKKADVVPCPCCRGEGTVPSKRAAEIKVALARKKQ